VIDPSKLRVAADLLRERGWCQGALTSGTKMCAIGALIAAGAEDIYVPISDGDYIARRFVMLAIDPIDSPVTWEVSWWNDHKARTASEVIDALEEAARIAESAQMTDASWPEVAS